MSPDQFDAPAIEFERVTVTYPQAAAPALVEVDFALEQGELAVLVGRTGSGKSTLLGAINGLVPHFTGGLLEGDVRVLGRSTRDHLPRDLADVVGYVGQDPLAGFVTDTVEEELAYGMEQVGVPPEVMRRRVEETLDLLGIAELRHLPLQDLSGGQQQRVAIGSVLTMQPQILVLDEPTSALDPTGAEEVLATVTRLVHDLSVTVVMAEHRIERVLQYADTLVHVGRDGRVEVGDPAEIMRTASVAPPVVELGRLAEWDPLPLSVRDARRRARRMTLPDPVVRPEPAPGEALLSAQDVHVRYGDFTAVDGVDLTLHAGRVTALMGRNGCGKSSLMWALQGARKADGGRVRVGDVDPVELTASQRRKLVAMVPQNAADLLYLETVAAECAAADEESDADPGTCEALLRDLVPNVHLDRHPRDLSEGQRLALVLAIQLTGRPQVLLLDEPTRGLDYDAKEVLRRTLRESARQGRAVLVTSHDVEFVAQTADEVVFMAQGEVVARGTTAHVLLGSSAFAPQVAKVLAPRPYLTVDQVQEALE